MAFRLVLIVALTAAVQTLPTVVAQGAFDAASAESQTRRGWNPLAPLLRLFTQPRRSGKRIFGRDKGKSTKTRQTRQRPEVVRARKNDDARRILVIGDVYARGLYGALDAIFAQSPDIVVVGKSSNESGLVADGGINWSSEIGSIVEDESADVVVVMLGANDFAGISSETGLIQPDNEAWPRAYGSRVQALLNQLAKREIPVFWVGLAPMNDPQLSAHAGLLSAIYRENVTLAGGVAIDIWDSFAGPEGQYSSNGPDVDGRVRQLRTSDGTGFTKAGYRKVGFFVEQELRSRMSSGLQLAAIQAITAEPEIIELGSIIPLYDSRIGLKVDLAGDEVKIVSPQEDSLQYKLVVAGEALPVSAGRVDDFRWTARP